MIYFAYNILSLFFFIVVYFFIDIMDVFVDMTFLELYLSISYFISLGWAMLKFNRYPLFLLVIIVFGLFIYSRFILDSVGLLPYQINLATRFIGNLFDISTMRESILIYIVSLVGLSFAFSFIYFIKNKDKSKNYNYSLLKKIGFYLILLSLPGVVFKMFVTLKTVMYSSSGYLALYLENPNSGMERVIEFISYKLYLVGVSFYISSNLNKKDFLKLSFFTLPITIVYLISGKRNEFGITILFLMWYWFSFIRLHDVSLKKLMLFGLLIFIPVSLLFQKVNDSRANGSQNDSSIIISISSFFAQQGVSGIVLPYYIEYNNKLSKDYPYILSPIIDRGARGGGQSLDLLRNTNYLGHELTAVVDYDAFLAGEGLGASYITELYSLGNSKFSVFLGMFLLGILILYFEINKNIPIIKYLSYLILSTILFLPRGEMFELFYEFIFLIIIWYIAKFFVKNKEINY